MRRKGVRARPRANMRAVGVYVGVYVERPGAQVATNTKTHAARDARSTTGVTARRKIEER